VEVAGLEKEKPPPLPPPPPNEKEGVEVLPLLLSALPKENEGVAAGGLLPALLPPPKEKSGLEVVAEGAAAAAEPPALPKEKPPVELKLVEEDAEPKVKLGGAFPPLLLPPPPPPPPGSSSWQSAWSTSSRPMPHTGQSPPPSSTGACGSNAAGAAKALAAGAIEPNEGVAFVVVLELPKENEGAGVILVSSFGADPKEKDGVLAGTAAAAAAAGAPNAKEEVEVEVVEVAKLLFPNEKEGVGVLAVLVFPKEKEGAVGFADGAGSSWHSEWSTSSMPMPHTGQSPPPSSTGALESNFAGAEKAFVVGAAKAKDGVAAETGVLAGFSKEKEGVAVGVVVEGAGAPNENEGAAVAEGVAVVEAFAPALKLPPKEKEGAAEGVAWAGVTPKEKAGSFGAAGVSSPPGNAKGSEELTPILTL
jgi:hypothetical protein